MGLYIARNSDETSKIIIDTFLKQSSKVANDAKRKHGTDQDEKIRRAVRARLAAGRISKDDRGYPVLPPDPTPGEQLLWAELTLMRCSMEDGPAGSPELEEQRALGERARELYDSLTEGSDGAPVRPDRGDLSYYSFITLATVGYGDVTPLTPLARTSAWSEAITGQFYLATLVAGLVGFKVTQAKKN